MPANDKEPAAPPMAVRQISESRVRPAEYEMTCWRVVLDEGMTIADALKPTAWAMAKTGMKIGDEIIAVDEENSFHLRLLVRDVRMDGLLVAVLSKVEFDKSAMGTQNIAGLNVRHRGAERRFVVETPSGTILKDGLTTRTDASRWALDYAAQTGA